MPLCSMPEYIKGSIGYHGTDNQFCYIEEGDRQMCTRLYTVCPCSYDIDIFSNSTVHCFNPDFDHVVHTDQCVSVAAESFGYSLS